MDSVSTQFPLTPELLDIDTVRRVYVGGASARHVFRMAAAGLMPPGCKLGALRRWSRAELDDWVRGGCKPVNAAGTKRARG